MASSVRPLAWLALAQCRVAIAGMADEHVGKANLAVHAADAGQDLLVDAVLPADGGMVAKETHVMDHCSVVPFAV